MIAGTSSSTMLRIAHSDVSKRNIQRMATAAPNQNSAYSVRFEPPQRPRTELKQ